MSNSSDSEEFFDAEDDSNNKLRWVLTYGTRHKNLIFLYSDSLLNLLSPLYDLILRIKLSPASR